MKSKVVFIDVNLEKAFNKLAEQDPLKAWILKAVADLRENAYSGIQIRKRLIPREYRTRYAIMNLWKYDLPRGWRLLYTVTAENEVEIISAILDWFDHKDYERKMRY
jgi:hypothetical protein